MGPGEITQRYLDCEVTEDEALEYGREQSKLIMEVRGFEEERKLVNDQIKPRKLRVDALAQIIDTGIESREVECIWEYDWKHGIKSLRRLDTDAIVGDTKKIEEHEEEPLPL